VSPSPHGTQETTPSLALWRSNRVIGLFPELLGVGGVQEAGRQIARALDAITHRHGWEVQILSLNDARGEHQLPACDFPVRFYGFGRRKTSFVLSMMRQALSLDTYKLRVVLAAHPNLAPPASFIKCFSRSVKTIVMTHGVEVWSRLSLARRTSLSHADLVLAPSQDTAEKLTSVQGIPIEKIRKLLWPLNPEFLRLADSPAGLRLPPGFPQGSIVLTVGRWAKSERYKGLDDLIKATAELRSSLADLQLVVVGGGDDLARHRKLATDAGIADSVHFLEHLSREELAACYANADVFALPSTGEGFGLVFLEAMAFAKPIVAASCGGTMEVVEHGANGLLIPPHNYQSLADALNKLLRDDSLRTKLGRGGAEMVRRKHRFRDFELGLDQILEEVAGLHSSRARL